jgi:hypothetical protein
VLPPTSLAMCTHKEEAVAATVNLNNSSPTLTARRSSIYVAPISDLVRLSRDVGDRYRPQLRSDLARGLDQATSGRTP